MTWGTIKSTTWARLGAHIGILLAVAGLWLVPNGHARMSADRERVSPAILDARVTPAPPAEGAGLTASAKQPSALPLAAADVQYVPVPTAERPGHYTAAPAHAAAPAGRSAGAPAPPPASGGWGYDISWPQCDGSYPTTADVLTVGVTNGRPFTTNPCLGTEWGWARTSKFAGGSQAYINLELDGTSSGPHACAAEDHACRAYDYGMITARDAIGRGTSQGVRPDFWWLDVEVGNNWSDDQPDWNARAVQGAIDVFQQRGLPVGVYSSYDQWTQIVPDTYRPAVPVWRAVVGDASMAASMCAQSHSFTSGSVFMVQYDDHGFDQDYICPAGQAAFRTGAAHPH
ncbi:MAG: hypothetical protein ABR598_00215 [Candidatus Dormibacteria bacterium]